MLILKDLENIRRYLSAREIVDAHERQPMFLAGRNGSLYVNPDKYLVPPRVVEAMVDTIILAPKSGILKFLLH